MTTEQEYTRLKALTEALVQPGLAVPDLVQRNGQRLTRQGAALVLVLDELAATLPRASAPDALRKFQAVTRGGTPAFFEWCHDEANDLYRLAVEALQQRVTQLERSALRERIGAAAIAEADAEAALVAARVKLAAMKESADA